MFIYLIVPVCFVGDIRIGSQCFSAHYLCRNCRRWLACCQCSRFISHCKNIKTVSLHYIGKMRKSGWLHSHFAIALTSQMCSPKKFLISGPVKNCLLREQSCPVLLCWHNLHHHKLSSHKTEHVHYKYTCKRHLLRSEIWLYRIKIILQKWKKFIKSLPKETVTN